MHGGAHLALPLQLRGWLEAALSDVGGGALHRPLHGTLSRLCGSSAAHGDEAVEEVALLGLVRLRRARGRGGGCAC